MGLFANVCLSLAGHCGLALIEDIQGTPLFPLPVHLLLGDVHHGVGVQGAAGAGTFAFIIHSNLSLWRCQV